MVKRTCDCPVCTEGVPDDLRQARLIFDDELRVHWLITTGDSSWDVAACGVVLDIDNDHMLVREPFPAANICGICMRNVIAEDTRHD